MKLDRVTFTGADDETNIDRMFELSAQYSFIEWGILLSRKQQGTRRFPWASWIQELVAKDEALGRPLKLSLHLCGEIVRKLCLGELILPGVFILPSFQRVQLNFHDEPHPVLLGPFLDKLKHTDVKWIFQIENTNKLLWEFADRHRVNCFPLFDKSGGLGISPAAWPISEHYYCGYAGGLGPDNVEKELQTIGWAAQGRRFWIDMETKVRTDDGKTFDLDKVRRVCELVSPYIKGDRF